jgi:triosephosphate isomerase
MTGNIATESDAVINKKTRKVLDAGLSPILCVGETKEEYQLNLNKAICALQLSKGLAGVTKEEMARVTIAYEPVWAIGTGLTATPEIAQEVHAYIRSWLAQMYDQTTADAVRIQYGGSVTPDTVDSLMACPGVAYSPFAFIPGFYAKFYNILPRRHRWCTGWWSLSSCRQI